MLGCLQILTAFLAFLLGKLHLKLKSERVVMMLSALIIFLNYFVIPWNEK